MKHTKEILYTTALVLSLSILLSSSQEAKGTEKEVTPATAVSYNREIELDFVEKPEKRNREQALEKMKELSRWYPALYFVYENEERYPIELILSGAGNPEMAVLMDILRSMNNQKIFHSFYSLTPVGVTFLMAVEAT